VSHDRTRAEFETWHVYDAGGPTLRLKVRYREGVEVPDWRDGPDLLDMFERASAEGWHAYDREPGTAPGEYAIFYMKRDAPPPSPGRRSPGRAPSGV
jgi:hypothetical protein